MHLNKYWILEEIEKLFVEFGEEQNLSYMSQFQIIEYLGLPHTLEHFVLQH